MLDLLEGPVNNKKTSIALIASVFAIINDIVYNKLSQIGGMACQIKWLRANTGRRRGFVQLLPSKILEDAYYR